MASAAYMSFVTTKCISSGENDVLSKKGLQTDFLTYNEITVCEIPQSKTQSQNSFDLKNKRGDRRRREYLC